MHSGEVVAFQFVLKRCWIELVEGDDSDEEIFSVEM